MLIFISIKRYFQKKRAFLIPVRKGFFDVADGLSAAVDADRETQLFGRLAQGADHPVALTFPEGAYLKGLICRVW